MSDILKTRKVAFTMAALLLASWVLASCASNRTSYRKCNGKKAIMTPMGPM